jgi:hypothetical protein
MQQVTKVLQVLDHLHTQHVHTNMGKVMFGCGTIWQLDYVMLFKQPLSS